MYTIVLCKVNTDVLVSVSVHVSVRLFANRKPIAVFVVISRVTVHGLRWVLLRLVMDFRRRAEALLPVVRPIMVLHGHLLGGLGVPAHGHAVDEAAHERQETEYEEYNAQNPVGMTKRKINGR